MLGLLVSSFIAGTMADIIGRKPVLFAAVFVGCTGSLAGAFVNDWISYAVCRFFTGCGKMKI